MDGLWEKPSSVRPYTLAHVDPVDPVGRSRFLTLGRTGTAKLEVIRGVTTQLQWVRQLGQPAALNSWVNPVLPSRHAMLPLVARWAAEAVGPREP